MLESSLAAGRLEKKTPSTIYASIVTVLAVSSYWPDAENEYEDDFTLDAVFYPELQILEISFKVGAFAWE